MIFFRISKVIPQTDSSFYFFSLALPCTIEKKLVIFFPEMINACPLMNKLEKEIGLFGLFMAEKGSLYESLYISLD